MFVQPVQHAVTVQNFLSVCVCECLCLFLVWHQYHATYYDM